MADVGFKNSIQNVICSLSCIVYTPKCSSRVTLLRCVLTALFKALSQSRMEGGKQDASGMGIIGIQVGRDSDTWYQKGRLSQIHAYIN